MMFVLRLLFHTEQLCISTAMNCQDSQFFSSRFHSRTLVRSDQRRGKQRNTALTYLVNVCNICRVGFSTVDLIRLQVYDRPNIILLLALVLILIRNSPACSLPNNTKGMGDPASNAKLCIVCVPEDCAVL